MPQELVAQQTKLFLPYKITMVDGEEAYAAGLPSYPMNFSRDTIIAGILASDSELLASQLGTSAQHQGLSDNLLTGEQLGKIHHQLPGVQFGGREGYTTYNACDTTALFLIGAEALRYLDSDRYAEFFLKHRGSLHFATQYILNQSESGDNLFRERPPDGANRYNLRVTYWKDSVLPRIDGKVEPIYPVSYGIAHFMASRGILSAARLLDDPALEDKADHMYHEGISAFMTPDNYVVYQDAEGKLCQASSDELHSLAYIPSKYAGLLPLSKIRGRAQELVTPYGYMCTPETVAKRLSDDYHGDKVWVFEQAFIDYGAVKFGLNDQAEIAKLIAAHIGEGQELFGIQGGQLVPQGNSQQLWSVATGIYFNSSSYLRDTAWL